MSISSYASDSSAASQPHSQAFTQSTPSRQSGMVQPVVQEMFATVHAAGSSLLGLLVHVQPSIRQPAPPFFRATLPQSPAEPSCSPATDSQTDTIIASLNVATRQPQPQTAHYPL
eukprot:scaffold49007_cov264-Isochrysis_galbana.AAC.1